MPHSMAQYTSCMLLCEGINYCILLIMLDVTTRTYGILSSSTTRTYGILSSSTTRTYGIASSSTTRTYGILSSSTTRTYGILSSSTFHYSTVIVAIFLQTVILHVRDISHPDTEAQKANVIATLTDLQLPDTLRSAVIEVCNKVDLLPPG